MKKGTQFLEKRDNGRLYLHEKAAHSQIKIDVTDLFLSIMEFNKS